MKISSCCFSAIGLWYIRRPENARDPRATLEEHTSTVMDYINYHVDSVISRKLIRKSAQPTLVNSCATLAEELNYFDRDSRDQMVQAPSPEQYKVTTHQKQNQRNIRSIVSLSLSSPCVSLQILRHLQWSQCTNSQLIHAKVIIGLMFLRPYPLNAWRDWSWSTWGASDQLLLTSNRFPIGWTDWWKMK